MERLGAKQRRETNLASLGLSRGSVLELRPRALAFQKQHFTYGEPPWFQMVTVSSAVGPLDATSESATPR